MAPATIERMTSLTVPPWASLTRFRSPRSVWVIWKRRWGPISTLKTELGAAIPAVTIFEVAPTPFSTWRGPRRAARKPR